METRNEMSRAEIEVENISEYLSGIEPGYTVVVHRVEPEWAKGYLDEYSVSETTKPIDMKFLINQWGGHKLRLRFRNPKGQWVKHQDIELYTFDPLMYGQKMKRPDRNPHLAGDEEPQNSQYFSQQGYPIQYPYQIQQKDDKKDYLEMMALMQKMRNDDLTALSALIKQQAHPAPLAPPPVDPFRMLTGAFNLFAQFQQLKAPQAESDNDEILGFLGKAVDVFAANNKPQQETRITPPINNPISADLSDALSTQDPEEAISTLQKAVGQMDPDKQARTMAALLGSIEKIGGTDLLLDQLEKRGILDPGDEYASGTEDDESPDSGREHEPDESHYTDSGESD